MQKVVLAGTPRGLNLTIPDIIGAPARQRERGLRPDVGRREFRIRTVAEYRSIEDIKIVVVPADGVREVRIADLAEVDFAMSAPQPFDHAYGDTLARDQRRHTP